MYNEDLKKRFVIDYTTKISSAKNCEYTFNATEKYEEKYSKDICQMNIEEISETIQCITGIRSSESSIRVTILRAYSKWCLSNDIPGANDSIFKIDTNDTDKIRTKMVVNPLGLNVFLNSIYDKEEEKTTDNVYRCFLWMAFSGLSANDTLFIKDTDVNFTTLSINYNGYDYPIYRESIAAFRNCAELTYFVYKNQNYSNDINRPRVDGNLLLRGVRSAPSLGHLQADLGKKNKDAFERGKTSLKLSFNRVWLSGVFYRAYEMEMAGFNVDFLDVVNRITEGKEYAVYRQTQEGKRKIIADSYSRDYEKWKIAFGL